MESLVQAEDRNPYHSLVAEGRRNLDHSLVRHLECLETRVDHLDLGNEVGSEIDLAGLDIRIVAVVDMEAGVHETGSDSEAAGVVVGFEEEAVWTMYMRQLLHNRKGSSEVRRVSSRD